MRLCWCALQSITLRANASTRPQPLIAPTTTYADPKKPFNLPCHYPHPFPSSPSPSYTSPGLRISRENGIPPIGNLIALGSSFVLTTT